MRLSLLLSLVESDFKSRFAGSVLGVIWAFLSPILTIGIYWFVYTVALRGPEIQGAPYLLWLIAGILPWFFLSESLTGATSCFWDYRFLVRKTRFQSGFLPLVRVLSSLWIHLPLLGLGYLAFSVSHIPPCIGQLWIFLWILLAFAFALALGRILALWCARLKDVSYGLQAALQLGFWITPIFWNPAELPPMLQSACGWNPAAILIFGYRDSLLLGKTPRIRELFFLLGLIFVLFLLGHLLSKKIQPTLADRL